MSRFFSKLHYAWIIALTGMLVVFGAVGLARFAFGIILPAMARDLGLGYGQQGILGTSYFLGYLAVLAAMSVFPSLVPRFGARRLCTAGLLLVAVSLAAISQNRDYLIICVLYGLTGIGSGGAFVPVVSLAAQWFYPSHRGRGAGFIISGAGIGIVVSGFLVPRLQPAFGLADWQLVWLIFAIAVAGLGLLAGLLLRDRPADLGLQPLGTALGTAIAVTANDRPGSGTLQGHWPILAYLGLIYAIYAATCLTYTTFIVTVMVQDFNVTEASAGVLWAWVGFLSIFSGALFGFISDRLGRRQGMIVALVVQLFAFVLIAFDSGDFGLYLSVLLFGISAWSLVSITAAAAGDYFGTTGAAAGFAALTLTFAIGQSLGPAGAGLLSEMTGDFAASFAVASGLNLTTITLCWFLRPPPARNPATAV